MSDSNKIRRRLPLLRHLAALTPRWRVGAVATLAATLLAPALAPAQVPWPQLPCIISPPQHALPNPVPRPVGTPQQLQGSCTAVYEANAIGGAVAFWCRQRAPKPPVLYLYAVRWSAVTPEMLADIAKLGLPGADNRDRIRDMQARHQTQHVLDMCDVWGPMRERIDAARPGGPLLPPMQPTEGWSVDGPPFQNIPTRSYASGLIGAQTTTYVQSGSRCDCAAFSAPIDTARRWCAVVPAQKLAATCVPKP